MPSTKVTFTGSLNHTLSAIIDEPNTPESPDTPPRAYAMFAHCFTCSKDVIAASRISRALAKLNIATFRFDFTGLGKSEGEFSDTTFSSNIADLVAGADWMRTNRKAPCVLIGHSLGGAAVLAAASQIPECRAIATIGAPAEPEHVTHLFSSAAADIDRDGQAEISIGGRPFTIGKQLLDDLRAQDPESRIKALKRALLIFHSPTDQIVGVESAAQIYTWAKHPKSFIAIDGADHMLTNPSDADYVANMLSVFVDRYAAD